jgi:hypothetical protein
MRRKQDSAQAEHELVGNGTWWDHGLCYDGVFLKLPRPSIVHEVIESREHPSSIVGTGKLLSWVVAKACYAGTMKT